MPWYERSQFRSSQLIAPLARRDADLRRHPRAPGSAAAAAGAATRAKWPRWLVPNCSSNPSAVVCRSGGVMTPALLMRRWIGAPSCAQRRRRAPPRSRARRGRASPATASPGGCSRILAMAASPLRGLRTGMTTSAPARGEPGGDAESDAVAAAGDDRPLAGQAGDGDIDSLRGMSAPVVSVIALAATAIVFRARQSLMRSRASPPATAAGPGRRWIDGPWLRGDEAVERAAPRRGCDA